MAFMRYGEKVRARAAKKAKKAASAKKSRAKAKGEKPVPVKIVHDEDEKMGSPALSSYEKKRAKEKKENGGFDSYEIEEACRALEKAADVIQDKKMMAAVTSFYDKKHKKITSLAGLKAYAKQMDPEE